MQDFSQLQKSFVSITFEKKTTNKKKDVTLLEIVPRGEADKYDLPGKSNVHLIISQLSVMVILTIFLFYLSLSLSSSTYSNNKSKCRLRIFDLLTYRKIDFLSRYCSSNDLRRRNEKKTRLRRSGEK